MPFSPPIPHDIRPCPKCKRYICDHPENTSANKARAHVKYATAIAYRAIYGQPETKDKHHAKH